MVIWPCGIRHPASIGGLTTVYDKSSNVLSTTDGNGTITSYGYDADERQTREIDAYGTSIAQTLTTVYDKASDVLYTVDGRGEITSYGYDADEW